MSKLFFLSYALIQQSLGYADSYGEFEDPNTECIKSAQSPIDISNLATCPANTLSLDLNIIRNEMEFIIENDGYSLDASPFTFDIDNPNAIRSINVIHASSESIFRFKNGLFDTTPFPHHKEFCFDSIHFHWGKNNSYGSEHTIDGISSPLEIHFVSFSCDYRDIRTALAQYQAGNYKDQYVLGVVGVLFEIGEPNKALDAILNPEIITRVRNYHDKRKPNYVAYNYAKFNISDLIPENKEIIMYNGSLTTPPCYELVRWHVMKNKLTVSESQLLQFRRMMRKTNISSNDNWRPINPLNGRTIYNCKNQLMQDTVAQLYENTKIKTTKKYVYYIIGGVSFLIILFLALYCSIVQHKKCCKCGSNDDDLNGETLEQQRSNTLIMENEETPAIKKVHSKIKIEENDKVADKL